MDISKLNVQELLELPSKVGERLNEIFKSDIMGWYSVNFIPDGVWHKYDDEISYSNLDGDEAGQYTFDQYKKGWLADNLGLMYDFDIYGTSIWTIDEYTAFVGDNGSGYRDIYIFKNELELKWEEYDKV